MKGKKIVVWFSCGAASAVAAHHTIKLFGANNEVRVVNNPVAEEHPDNRRFLKDVERWLGQEIETCVNPKFPDASCDTVWRKRKFMSSVAGAPCTLELKKRARQHFEKENEIDYHVLGFTADEKSRHEKFIRTERSNVIPVLIKAMISKQRCIQILEQEGIDVPTMYKLGYPNANCIGCVKATSPTYWNKVRETHPNVFKERAKLSREIGSKLVRVKGERIFLDELDPKTKGRPLKSMTLECGIFCEEI